MCLYSDAEAVQLAVDSRNEEGVYPFGVKWQRWQDDATQYHERQKSFSPYSKKKKKKELLPHDFGVTQGSVWEFATNFSAVENRLKRQNLHCF